MGRGEERSGAQGGSALAMAEKLRPRIGRWLDRKAAPTIAVARRVDASAIEMEDVRIERRLVGVDSPVEATVARVPQRASSHIHGPATS